MIHKSDHAARVNLRADILARKGIIGCGAEYSVALHSQDKAVYVGADRFGQGEVALWNDVSLLACAPHRIIAVMKDGTLRMAGRTPVYAGFAELSGVRTASCSSTHAAVLLGNGRVVAEPCRGSGSDTTEWPTVIDVVCGKDFTVGLTKDHFPVMAGGKRLHRHVLSLWGTVEGIFTDYHGEDIFAITAEGRLLSTRRLPRAVRAWRNLVYVAANRRHIWGVTEEGRLLSTDPAVKAFSRNFFYAVCAVSESHAVALSWDGLVCAMGDNAFGQCDTRSFGTIRAHHDRFNEHHFHESGQTAERERDFLVRVTEAARYGAHLLCGDRLTACISSEGRVLATGSLGRAKRLSNVRALACGSSHLVALHENGTVSAEGNSVDGCGKVEAWRQIKSIAAGKYHTLGVTEDGRVLFCGRNHKGQGDVTEWQGIRCIYAANEYTVGLGYDGTLRLAGTPDFAFDDLLTYRKDPVDVAVADTHMVALYADGTVRSTQACPASQRSGDGEVWNTCGWHHVRAIAVGQGFTVGLLYGGQVVAVGEDPCVGEAVSQWRGVVSVACGESFILGLTADGRVLSASVTTDRASSCPDTSLWSDVLAIACGRYHAVGLTREGELLSDGQDGDHQCSGTAHFVLFRDIRQMYGHGRYSQKLEQEIRAQREAILQEKQIEEDPGIQPFHSFARAMREDVRRLLSRITGSDSHLTVIDTAGRTVTYRYETSHTLTEASEHTPLRITAAEDRTLLIYPDGRARERIVSTPDAPLSPLPNRLGDSHFYPVRDVAYGDSHYAVLLADGTVRAFGENDRGQGDVGGWSRINAIACGTDHTVGLREDGTVVATGARHRESISRSRGVAHTPRANPCAVEGWRGVASIACAGDVTVGLCSNGTVKAVGSSHYGQCNTDGWRDVVSVATSGNHTVALFGDGRVEAVGLNESGECRTQGWSRVVMIAVMPELTLGLRADGKVLAAGRHHQVLETLDSVRAMACFGRRRQVFVMADGSLRIHNRGSEYLPEPLGELRLFKPSVENSILRRACLHRDPVLTDRSLSDGFAVGMAHTATLGEQGTIHALGANESGQCDVRARHTAVCVSAGPYHTAVIRADGSLILSGRNTDGQSDWKTLNRELDAVGLSSDASEGDVRADQLAYAWKQVACGYDHTAALRSDGRVYAMGANPDGRCDTRKWREISRVACGVKHTVGLTAEGTCVAAGDNSHGQCDLLLWKQITMVAAGEFHTVGLRADGRVEAAGDNRKGQCHVEDLRDIIAVACTPDATLCLRADGRVILRGGSGEHDKAVEGLREIVALHTCEHRIAALTVDRRLILIPSTV